LATDVDSRSSTSWLEEALSRFRELDEPAGIGWSLAFLAMAAERAGDTEAAAHWGAEALEFGTARGMPSLVPQSQRILGIVAARHGEHAEFERLLGGSAAAHREAGNRFELALILGEMAWFADLRGEHRLALERLRETLRLSREIGSGDRMRWAIHCATGVLWRRRPGEAEMLLGATEAALHRLPRWAAILRTQIAPLEAAFPHVDLHQQRAAGRMLALERAADLALRIVEEELVVAAAEISMLPRDTPDGGARPGSGVFRCEGEYWTITYENAVCRLKDAKGLHYLAQLLRHPGREFHVLDLVRGPSVGERNSEEPRPQTDAGGLPILDEQAKAAYRQRLSDLRDELAEAERFHDAGRATRAREEIDALTEQLAAGVGLGGRDRVAGAAAERARSTVTLGIRSALKKVGARIPTLADQLTPRIRTGMFCVYLPDTVRPISWTF
jgi:hypothetical protein